MAMVSTYCSIAGRADKREPFMIGAQVPPKNTVSSDLGTCYSRKATVLDQYCPTELSVLMKMYCT